MSVENAFPRTDADGRMPSRRHAGTSAPLLQYALLGASLALWYFTSLPTVVTNLVIMLMPLEQDVEIGDTYMRESGLSRKLVAYAALPASSQALHLVGQRLVSALPSHERREFRWRFKIVLDDSMNAFALPGGMIVVHSGLLKAVRGPDELAGVVAHEIGHVVSRHGQKRLVEGQLISTLFKVLLPDGDGRYETIGERLAETIAEGALQLGRLRFSRENELEADARGFDLLVEAGLPVKGMIRFFEHLVLEEGTGRRASGVEQWLSTHPATEERIKVLREDVLSYDADEREMVLRGRGPTLGIDWRQVERELRSGSYGY